MNRPRAFLSWSTGKDSAHALHRVRQRREVDVVGLLTTVAAETGRVTTHGVRAELLDAQAAACELPVVKVALPQPVTNAEYEAILAATLRDLRRAGVTQVLFADLFLKDVRAYREKQIEAAGLTALFPLWRTDTDRLAQEMLESGLRAQLICVDTDALPSSYLGRQFDDALLRTLPPHVDPCGERGEFHTFVHTSPVFREPLTVSFHDAAPGGRFVSLDLILEAGRSP